MDKGTGSFTNHFAHMQCLGWDGAACGNSPVVTAYFIFKAREDYETAIPAKIRIEFTSLWEPFYSALEMDWCASGSHRYSRVLQHAGSGYNSLSQQNAKAFFISDQSSLIFLGGGKYSFSLSAFRKINKQAEPLYNRCSIMHFSDR